MQSDKFTTDPNEIMWEYVKTLINVDDHIITTHECIDYVRCIPVVIIIQYKGQVLAYIAELPYNFDDEIERINQTILNCENMSHAYKLLEENYL